MFVATMILLFLTAPGGATALKYATPEEREEASANGQKILAAVLGIEQQDFFWDLQDCKMMARLGDRMISISLYDIDLGKSDFISKQRYVLTNTDGTHTYFDVPEEIVEEAKRHDLNLSLTIRLAFNSQYWACPNHVRAEHIKDIQEHLSLLGYDFEKIDGIAGNETKKNVVRFQQDNGLIETGIIGKDLYDRIMRTDVQAKYGILAVSSDGTYSYSYNIKERDMEELFLDKRKEELLKRCESRTPYKCRLLTVTNDGFKPQKWMSAV